MLGSLEIHAGFSSLGRSSAGALNACGSRKRETMLLVEFVFGVGRPGAVAGSHRARTPCRAQASRHRAQVTAHSIDPLNTVVLFHALPAPERDGTGGWPQPVFRTPLECGRHFRF
jgi:hypothetical protein